MNTKLLLISAVAAAGLALGVNANQLAGPMISGQVTAAGRDGQITVDGKTYRVKSDSPAAAAARTAVPGQVVDVILNGPASSSASQAINIVAHAR